MSRRDVAVCADTDALKHTREFACVGGSFCTAGEVRAAGRDCGLRHGASVEWRFSYGVIFICAMHRKKYAAIISHKFFPLRKQSRGGGEREGKHFCTLVFPETHVLRSVLLSVV